MTEPHPEAVARIAERLASLGSNHDALDALGSDIQAYGIGAFLQAARQTAAVREALALPPAPVAGVLGVDLLAPFGPRGDVGAARATWTDCIGSRIAQPLRVFHPATLDDLRSIVRQAAAEGCRVKAVGSGHSFTDVATTRDFLIETNALSRPLALAPALLRPGAHPETLFETEAGIRVRELNDALWNAGLGLENMGGYDGQTIAGVISTSTHGSGLAFGPLSSQVVSLTLVAGDGAVYRVEPAGGITDPDRWAALHPDITLKQDDDWFAACQVGIGCMGLIYSVVLRARERYFLKEERTLGVWSQLRGDIAAGQVLRDNRHYEALVNPYATNGDHTCLITRRNPTPPPADPPLARPNRNFFVELAASVPGVSDLLQAVFNLYPPATPFIIDKAMEAIARDYIDRSYFVFNIGAANNTPAYGSEIGFPLDRCVEATDRILEIAAQRRQSGEAYLTSPFSLRFVKSSNAYMSMMYGSDTCMIEFPMLKGTIGGRELLQQIEREMYALGGRPHWGLLNFLSGAGDLIAAMYPMLPRWLAVYRQIDPSGMFTNAFTERCGFAAHGFAR